MSGHSCGRCAKYRADIQYLKYTMLHRMRTAEQAPGTPRAAGCRSQIEDLKQRIGAVREDLAAHLREVAA